MLERLGDREGLADMQAQLTAAGQYQSENGDSDPDVGNEVTDRLLAICREFTELAPDDVVVKEPYIPYIPGSWNGVLVLAIAQNQSLVQRILSEYCDYLDDLSPEARYWRLRPDRNPNNPLVRRQADALGIGPWDDESMGVKMAVMCLGLCPQETAVSNAVPWSRRTEDNKDSPPAGVQHEAISFWRSVFGVWRPERIVAVGRPAEDVVRRAGMAERCIYVPFPSGQYFTVQARAINVGNTLNAHPVIRDTLRVLGLTASEDLQTRKRLYLAKCAIDAAQAKGWDIPDRLA